MLAKFIIICIYSIASFIELYKLIFYASEIMKQLQHQASGGDILVYVGKESLFLSKTIVAKFTSNLTYPVSIQEDPTIFQHICNFLNDSNNKFPAKWDYRLQYWKIPYAAKDLIFESLEECICYPITISDALCSWIMVHKDKCTNTEPVHFLSDKYIQINNLNEYLYSFTFSNTIDFILSNYSPATIKQIHEKVPLIRNKRLWIDLEDVKKGKTYTVKPESDDKSNIWVDYARIHIYLDKVQKWCESCNHYHLEIND
jgi:hypothetical protein